MKTFLLFLIGSSFFTPLVVWTDLLYPFIVPKVFLFRSVVLLMGAVYLLLVHSNCRKYRIRRTPLNIAVALFFFSFTLSSLFAVDKHRSVWDGYERMLGWFTVSHYLLYYFIVTSTITKLREWYKLWKLFLLAGAIVVCLGVTQFVGWGPFTRSDGRMSSTLGHHGYFGAYTLCVLFVSILVCILSRNRFYQCASVLLAIAGFGAMLLSGTRGVLVGFTVALVTGICAYGFTLTRSKRRLLLSGAIFFIVLLLVLIIFRKTPLVKNIPTVGPLLNTKISEKGTAYTRLLAWQISITAFGDHWLLGWGPNNYYHAFNKYYRPEFMHYGGKEIWVDNAHNVIFNTLVVQGIVGVVSYLALFVAAIYMLVHAYRKRGLPKNIAVLCSSFLIAHFSCNLFLFETPNSYLCFFLVLAFINAITTDTKLAELSACKQLSPLLMAVVIWIAMNWIYVSNVLPAQANALLLQACTKLRQNQSTQAVILYQYAVRINSPHTNNIRTVFIDVIDEVIPAYIRSQKSNVAKDLFVLAYREIQKNQILHPRDIQPLIRQAQLARHGITLLKRTQLLLEAEAVLTKAKAYSPRRQHVAFMLAQVKFQLKKIPETIAILQQSIENDPKLDEGWWRLALLYYETDNHEQALQIIQQARAKKVQFGKQGKSIVAMILKDKK